jgi:uncharacterized FlgJ-related protein
MIKKIYFYDKQNLSYQKVGLKQVSRVILIVFSFFTLFGFTTANLINSELEKIPVLIKLNEQKFSEQNLIDKIRELRLEHPEIVIAQARLESNNFTSNIFKQNNNFFGMKCAGSRPTINKGENFGHAEYKCWQDCVIDYALWQSAYARNLSTEEYLTLLDNIYAEDGSYVIKLRQILNKK